MLGLPLAFAAPAVLAALVGLVRAGTVSHQAAKRVYAEMAQSPDGDPTSVAEPDSVYSYW